MGEGEIIVPDTMTVSEGAELRVSGKGDAPSVNAGTFDVYGDDTKRTCYYDDTAYTIYSAAFVDRDTEELSVDENEIPENALKRLEFGKKGTDLSKSIIDASLIPMADGSTGVDVTLVGATGNCRVMVAFYKDNTVTDVYTGIYNGTGLSFSTKAEYDYAKVMTVDAEGNLIPFMPASRLE